MNLLFVILYFCMLMALFIIYILILNKKFINKIHNKIHSNREKSINAFFVGICVFFIYTTLIENISKNDIQRILCYYISFIIVYLTFTSLNIPKYTNVIDHLIFSSCIGLGFVLCIDTMFLFDKIVNNRAVNYTIISLILTFKGILLYFYLSKFIGCIIWLSFKRKSFITFLKLSFYFLIITYILFKLVFWVEKGFENEYYIISFLGGISLLIFTKIYIENLILKLVNRNTRISKKR